MSSYREKAFSLLEATRNQIFELGQTLFDHPERGFQEFETAAIIGDYLERAGIPFQQGLARTGIRATLGTEGYHLALVADMDALEVQGDKGPVLRHACGHSIQVTVMLALMRIFKDLGIPGSGPGRISFLATPAEEFLDLDFRRELIRQGAVTHLSGKQSMIALGLFDDVDAVLSCHVSGDDHFRFDVGSTLAGFNVKQVRFLGRAAHSGVAPHLGRNALQAATLCIQASSFLQEQYPPEAGVRLYPILTQGGLSANAIPEVAVLETYLRAHSTEDLLDLDQRFEALAGHCAGALGLGHEIVRTSGYLPLVQSAELNEVIYRNMLNLCRAEDILVGPSSSASGDMGDLASLLPAVQFGFSGTSGRVHSAAFEIWSQEGAYLDPARVLLGTVIDLFENPALQVSNARYMEDKKAYLASWLGSPDA